jgi:hypothetical protein
MKIPQAKNTPLIITEDNTLQLIGESYPENAIVFYAPIIDWVKNKISEQKEIKLIFKLNYFNTTSSKIIIDIFWLLDEYEKNNKNSVNIEWYHEEENIDIKESGEDFASDLSFNFEIKSFKE